MLYLQLKAWAVLHPGEAVLVRHAADVMGDGPERPMDLPAECPSSPGVWRLPALAVVKALKETGEEITVIGHAECFAHIVPEKKRNRAHALRTAAAFLLPYAVGVFFGVALFYCLPGRKGTVSPPDIKLGEYRKAASGADGGMSMGRAAFPHPLEQLPRAGSRETRMKPARALLPIRALKEELNEKER